MTSHAACGIHPPGRLEAPAEKAQEGELCPGPLLHLPELCVGQALPQLSMGRALAFGGGVGVGVGVCSGVIGTGGGGGPREVLVVLCCRHTQGAVL